MCSVKLDINKKKFHSAFPMTQKKEKNKHSAPFRSNLNAIKEILNVFFFLNLYFNCFIFYLTILFYIYFFTINRNG